MSGLLLKLLVLLTALFTLWRLVKKLITTFANHDSPKNSPIDLVPCQSCSILIPKLPNKQKQLCDACATSKTSNP